MRVGFLLLTTLAAAAVVVGLAGAHRASNGVVAVKASDVRTIRPHARTARIHPAPRLRYMIDSGSSTAAVASFGWNLLDVGSKEEADALVSGTRGLVWVGDYDNGTCTWEVSDTELQNELPAMAGDRKILGFFISDEADPHACPAAAAEHAARTRLIHRLTAGKPTIMVLDSNSGAATLDQIPGWLGATDYVALDPYPCYVGKPCKYAWIDQVIKAANRAGLHYWGVVQAFADSSWRWPTPAEERHMLSQWAASEESGYMTFSWKWHGQRLANHPELLRVFKTYNRTGSLAPPHKPKPRKTSAAAVSRHGVAAAATELHYTYEGPSSVTFDWDGTARSLRYGRTRRYGAVVLGNPPTIAPFSSKGPFWEASLTKLMPGSTYYYTVGNVASRFSTPPIGAVRFDFEADVGASTDFDAVGPTQKQIAADKPAFVIVAGDLTYGNDNGLAAIDQHFNDVMVWSRSAAYMPSWGNHEWDEPTDDLRNYKGRFLIPHPQSSPDAPSKGCCGEDWGWFDAGGVRFISYPEPYSDAAWTNWGAKSAPLMAAAQRNPRIHFIVTFGHRPAYSTGYHPGDRVLAAQINALGDRFSKYVLNLNGHSHDYERFVPIHRVVHITAGGGGADLEPWSGGKDSRTAFRALHLEHLRIEVTSSQMRIAAICGPSISQQDVSCALGSTLDTYTIHAPHSP